MELSLDDFELVLAVEREGSFGRAAGALMLSQPAVSQRIRQIERRLGYALFQRTSRGASATPAAAALLPYARRCLELASEAVEAGRQTDGTRPLVVAVHSTFAQRVMPLVLDSMGPTHRRVSIRDVHSEAVGGLLLDGDADIGFALSTSAPRGLRRVALAPDPVVALAVPDHPAHAARRPSVTSLRSSLLAVNAWGQGADDYLMRLRTHGVEEWRVRYCGDAATALTLARTRRHVAFVTRSSAAPFAGDWLRPIPLAGLAGWRVRLDLLHRRSDGGEPLVRRIADVVATADSS